MRIDVMSANTRSWEASPAFAGILKEQEIFGTGHGDDAADQINNWFDKLMLQSGLAISPSMLLAVSLCAGLSVAGAVFVVHENLLTTALGALVGFMLPVIVSMMARTRRQDQMMRQIPS